MERLEINPSTCGKLVYEKGDKEGDQGGGKKTDYKISHGGKSEEPSGRKKEI